jgi:phosphatidylglycerophosphate synthase
MSHNTWTHVIIRPLVRPLIGTAVTPNHLTALRLATGIGTCLLLATGRPACSGLGALVFLLSFFLDRADGELARQGGASTAWGHRFDLFADYSTNILVFLGMGIGQRETDLGSGALVLGAVAGCAIVAIFWLVSRIEQIDGIGAAAFPTAGGFDPDDAMLVVPLAVWFDAELVILVAAAIGAPVFLLWTGLRFHRYLGHVLRPSASSRAPFNE